MVVTAKQQKVEVVLGAGGGRGPGHLGLLQYLEEMHVEVSMYTGASIGAVVAAFYVNGYSLMQIAEILRRELGSYGWRGARALVPPLRLSRLRAGGIINSVGIFRHIVDEYGLQPKPNLRIVACEAGTRQAYAFEGSGYDMAVALAASCAAPGVIRPVPWQGKLLVDGGVSNETPTEFCTGTAIVSCLDKLRRRPAYRLSPFGMVAAHYELRAGRRQDECESACVLASASHIFVKVGQPDVPTATFNLPRAQYARMIRRGYEAAKSTLAPLIEDQTVPTRR